MFSAVGLRIPGTTYATSVILSCSLTAGGVDRLVLNSVFVRFENSTLLMSMFETLCKDVQWGISDLYSHRENCLRFLLIF